MTAYMEYLRRSVEADFPGGKWVDWDGKKGIGWLISSPLREDRNPSFIVLIDGRNAYDRGTGRNYLWSELYRLTGKQEPMSEEAFYRQGNSRVNIDTKKIIEHGQGKTDSEDERKRAEAFQMWREGTPATSEHWYIKKNGHDPEGLRITTKAYAFKGDVETPAGTLLVPAHDLDDTLQGVERILPGKKRHRGTKKGCYFGDKPMPYDTLYLVEGWATGEAVRKILGPGKRVAVAFSLALMETLNNEMKKRCPGLDVVFLPDTTEDGSSIERLRNRGLVVELPAGRGKNFDWDDELRANGLEAAR
ncbi:MAG: hypothetical protein GX310_03270, partial [Synergistaceae bacterium]|nr:hypothetical protein [Synergistaceae bacterium]